MPSSPGTAIERWHALVRERREQMDALMAAMGGPPEDWWAGRGGALARGIGDPAIAPPFGLTQIAERLDRSDTLLDVGGGAGRFAIPLSRVARRVTLLEPSPWMIERAREALSDLKIENCTAIERAWPEADVDPHDAVLLANVLSPYEDIERWIERALAAARRWLFIIHGTGLDAVSPTPEITEALQGQPRIRQPNLADLIPVLHELGITPDVLMGERRFARVFDSRDHAARDMAFHALVAPTPDMLRRIRTLLRGRLLTRDDGRVELPDVVGPVGLLIWRLRG